MPDERLLAIKDRAAAEFFKIPGVTGVGLGGRERDGRPTGELVIKVFVRQKRPAEELTPGETLPQQFEGIGVDVSVLGDTHLEMSDPVPLVSPPPSGSPATSEYDTDDKRYRPLKGGGRVQVALAGSGLGTGGSLWRHTTDASKRYLLTNFHVVSATGGAAPVAGTTRLGQPTNQSAPTKCCSDIVGTFAGGGRDTVRDAALVQLDPGTQYVAEVRGIGFITGTYDIDPTTDLVLPTPYPVRKYGARTRLTGGTVESVNTTHTTDGITRTNVIVVKPNPNELVPDTETLYFNDRGDSGSAIVNDDHKIVALHFAGDDTTPHVHKGLELPIKDIVQRFNDVEHIPIAPETATQHGDVRTVPGAQPVAPARELERTLTGALPSYGTALTRFGTDLTGTAGGRDLRALWLDHHQELLDLVDRRRRVTIAWHRGGGPALLQTLIRMSADPALAMPATVNGEPPMRRLAGIHAVFRANASPELRAALDRALAAVPDPAGLTYDQIMAALATR